MFGPLLDAVFPRRCAGCGSGGWPFCARCRAELVVLAPPWCERCGAPSPSPRRTCRDCPQGEISVARSALGFDGPARRAIHRLKFGGWRSVAEALGGAMASAWRGAPFEPEAVVPVPLSHRRLAERGYDQAGALAEALGPRLGLPVLRLLRRVRDPGPQARRGGSARREAMRGTFASVGRPPMRVLVVDDVLTTGATVEACAEVLLEAGASAVGLLTAARSAASLRRPRSGALEGSLYSATGSRPGLWLPRGTSPR